MKDKMSSGLVVLDSTFSGSQYKTTLEVDVLKNNTYTTLFCTTLTHHIKKSTDVLYDNMMMTVF